MAKKAKGNRVQVILECTEMRIVVCRELLVILQLRIEKIPLKDWS